MLFGKRIIAVLPAYEAGKTLEKTFHAIPHDTIDDVILVDDASKDDTVDVARKLGIHVVLHESNRGYGANQKTCYLEALKLNADIVVMLHPDYQYEPRLIVAMASMIASGVYDVVIASRILGNTTKAGGMPRYKYYANRLLTLVQNFILGAKLSEYHTGYRGFSKQVLESLPLLANSDNFVFDNEMLAQVIAKDFSIGEISCPTRYFPEASSISFSNSVVYGLGVLRVCLLYRLWKMGFISPLIFEDKTEFLLNQKAGQL